MKYEHLSEDEAQERWEQIQKWWQEYGGGFGSKIEKAENPPSLESLLKIRKLAAEEELALACEDPFWRGVEGQFRRTLYKWRHLPVDMIVEDVFYAPIVIHDTGFGMSEQSEKRFVQPVFSSLKPKVYESGDGKTVFFPD